MVTNQKLGDSQLATKGWMAHAKRKRLVAFDGKVLHGVIPGKGVTEDKTNRRVTVMLAFWEHIQVREEPGFGSARPFPGSKFQEKWLQQLRNKFGANWDEQQKPKYAAPIPLDHVYESLDGTPWTPQMGLPEYDEVFQGF